MAYPPLPPLAPLARSGDAPISAAGGVVLFGVEDSGKTSAILDWLSWRAKYELSLTYSFIGGDEPIDATRVALNAAVQELRKRESTGWTPPSTLIIDGADDLITDPEIATAVNTLFARAGDVNMNVTLSARDPYSIPVEITELAAIRVCLRAADRDYARAALGASPSDAQIDGLTDADFGTYVITNGTDAHECMTSSISLPALDDPIGDRRDGWTQMEFDFEIETWIDRVPEVWTPTTQGGSKK
ncbi:hypothetical protein KIH27_15950 [Mycobacterium sp. M1]|uniref:AAA+ ATPase domain-containing protein n=1 Tax=Mycolicibacter acidiphilus TaxID=2835306 RepID=A0ABS5RL98_9MYCO|nr:hypothetical protein [Mycolicibacter acidiphilus]MBS9535081.1 hypothetical protein [Mycolicibacter acidiphilus]